MNVSWIAVDWGTSRLRVSAINSQGAVIERKESDKGMGVLPPSGYEQALLTLISPWLKSEKTTKILCCGMVGARQGWFEAPYRTVPCAPVMAAETVLIETEDPRISVAVVPGLCQPNPADVMRGEETQIAGFLDEFSGFEGVICLPGTHSKWARISGGKVISFQTHMTGELFEFLSIKSVLRHSTATQGWSGTDFNRGVATAMADPAKTSAMLFKLRAEHLLDDQSKVTARAFLSGLLIGQELAASQDYWQDQRIAIIGADALAQRYRSAMEMLALSPEIYAVEKATLAGLKIAGGKFDSDN